VLQIEYEKDMRLERGCMVKNMIVIEHKMTWLRFPVQASFFE
jgi:hypothetical protein